MFDCSSFLHRMGWGQKDLAEKIGCATSTIGMWCVGKSYPSYSVIIQLLELGMTPKELFGEKWAELFRPVPEESDSIFDEKVRKSLLHILNATK